MARAAYSCPWGEPVRMSTSKCGTLPASMIESCISALLSASSANVAAACSFIPLISCSFGRSMPFSSSFSTPSRLEPSSSVISLETPPSRLIAARRSSDPFIFGLYGSSRDCRSLRFVVFPSTSNTALLSSERARCASTRAAISGVPSVGEVSRSISFLIAPAFAIMSRIEGTNARSASIAAAWCWQAPLELFEIWPTSGTMPPLSAMLTDTDGEAFISRTRQWAASSC